MSGDARTPVRGGGMLKRHEDMLEQAVPVEYKELPEGNLTARLFLPEQLFPEEIRDDGGLRPAILFFPGGLWDQAGAAQFVTHCLHYCRLGFVAVSVEYRLAKDRPGGGVMAVQDARTAFRWARHNAGRLRIDTSRIIGAGCAAGAHAAAAAAYCDAASFDEPGEDLTLDGAPDLLLLFSPVTDVTPSGLGFEKFGDKKLAKAASPSLQLQKGAPPAVLFHGNLDRVVPQEQTSRFLKAAKKRKIDVEAHIFQGQQHGFFHFNVKPELYDATLQIADAFLKKHGYFAFRHG